MARRSKNREIPARINAPNSGIDGWTVSKPRVLLPPSTTTSLQPYSILQSLTL